MQKMILSASPDFESISVPTNKIRLLIHRIVTCQAFDGFIMICIILNMVQMAMTYETATQPYLKALEIANYTFTAVFSAEAFLKFIAFGPRYFKPSWNKFDFFVVTTSLLDIILNFLNNLNSRFLRMGPQLARVLRVLRVSRIIRLIGKSKGLQALIQTITFSLPQLMNVLSLFLIVFFIYAVLGVFLFQKVQTGTAINNNMNFNNFTNALIILLKCIAGQGWPDIMTDSDQAQSTSITTLYFISFRFIGSEVMINLFVLIIIQQFNKYYVQQDTVIKSFKENLEQFKQTWKQYSGRHGGQKLKETEILQFLHDLSEPLGMRGQSDLMIKKETLKLGIRSQNGWVSFNELLYRSMKRVFMKKQEQKELMKLSELQTLLELHRMTEETLGVRDKIKKVSELYEDMVLNCNKFNPFLTQYQYQQSFQLWRDMVTPKQNQHNQEVYYDYINDYIQNLAQREGNQTQCILEEEAYESHYETLSEVDQENNQSISDQSQSADDQDPNPLIVIGINNTQQNQQSLKKISEEASEEFKVSIESLVQLKGALQRNQSQNNFLQSSKSQLHDKRLIKSKQGSGLSLVSRLSKSKKGSELFLQESSNGSRQRLKSQDVAIGENTTMQNKDTPQNQKVVDPCEIMNNLEIIETPMKRKESSFKLKSRRE